ncbi:MAG: hypothetical protein QM726_21625 [Chitinophagaceae bacterium]
MYTLIFCFTGDAAAYALYDELFNKGERKLRLVTDRELAFASWLHQAGDDGIFFTSIRLHDGFVIEPAMIKILVNRINYFAMPQFVKPADRSYAEMEMLALYTSFIYSINEKVLDGMPVWHINTSENLLLFYSLAVKAGLPVVDNQFTSSPRWEHPKDQKPLAPQKKATALWHKQSPNLEWENKPALYNESFTNLVKVEVVADKIICDKISLRSLQQKIKKFSSLIGRTVYEITLAEIKKEYKLYGINVSPALLSTEAIKEFAHLLISKK